MIRCPSIQLLREMLVEQPGHPERNEEDHTGDDDTHPRERALSGLHKENVMHGLGESGACGASHRTHGVLFGVLPMMPSVGTPRQQQPQHRGHIGDGHPNHRGKRLAHDSE